MAHGIQGEPLCALGGVVTEDIRHRRVTELVNRDRDSKCEDDRERSDHVWHRYSLRRVAIMARLTSLATAVARRESRYGQTKGKRVAVGVRDEVHCRPWDAP